MLYFFLMRSVVVFTEVRFSSTDNAKYKMQVVASNSNNTCHDRLASNIL